MTDTYIRSLKNGGFGYISGEHLCKTDTCGYYVDRNTPCFAQKSEFHSVMVKRSGIVIQVLESDVSQAGCKLITQEDLISGDYITVIKMNKKYISKGFEPD